MVTIYHHRPRRRSTVVADLKIAIFYSVVILLVILVASTTLRYSVFNFLLWMPLQASRLEREILRREALATNYLTSEVDLSRFSAKVADQTSDAFLSTRGPPKHELCVAIQSFYRLEPYAIRTLASLLHAQTHSEARPALLAVLDYEQSESIRNVMLKSHPKLAIITREELLSNYASAAMRNQYDEHHRLLNGIGSNAKDLWMTLQRIDYALALAFCNLNACGRCLVLENDALLSQDATVVALQAARWLDENAPEWGLLRLFKSDFFSGWEKTPSDRMVLTGLAVLGSIIGFCFAWKYKRSLIVWPAFGAIWSLCFPLLIGKQHLPFVGLRHSQGIVPADRDGSVSSIAHLYPQHVVAHLLQVIEKPCCSGFRKPIDLFIGDALRAKNASFWEVVPNRADHIGAKTSFGQDAVKQNRAWHAKFIQSDTFDPNSTPY